MNPQLKEALARDEKLIHMMIDLRKNPTDENLSMLIASLRSQAIVLGIGIAVSANANTNTIALVFRDLILEMNEAIADTAKNIRKGDAEDQANELIEKVMAMGEKSK